VERMTSRKTANNISWEMVKKGMVAMIKEEVIKIERREEEMEILCKEFIEYRKKKKQSIKEMSKFIKSNQNLFNINKKWRVKK